MSDATGKLAIEAVGEGMGPMPLPASGVLVIGASPVKAGLVLEGQGVSDVHCAVGRTKDGSYALKDLGSEFGTLLNGKPVKSARIAPGDQISLGSRRLRVLEDREAPAPAPTKGPPAKQDGAPKKAAAPLPQIPGYRVLRRLGRGAMGEVFLAVQTSLEREVALKVLDAKLADNADFVRRFQAEARAAAALHHSNVVTVFDVGATKDSHYLSMEFMDDGSLEDRLKSGGRISSSEVARILYDAAGGLMFAESRGIVHRDIKPDNLMRNRQGATKIADLGLATNVEAEGEDVGSGGRKVFGTPHFISPEQVRGERADSRSDLYSLGATAYRLLSGTTPYEGSSTREILRAKLSGDPVPIEERVPDIDPGVAAVVTRLMQRDPADRYPSASALFAELERLRAGSAQAAAARVEAKSGKRALYVGLGVVALAVAVGVFSILGGGDPDPDPDVTQGGPWITDGAGDTDEDPDALAQATDTDPNEASTDVDDGIGGDPAPGDTAERLFEIQAENALLRLDSESLSDEARRDRLRALASEYAGTSAATTALERAEAIETRLLLAQREGADEARRRDDMLSALRGAAALERRPLRAGDALRAMKAVPDQEALAADADFLAARDAIVDEVYRLAVLDLEQDLADAGAAQERGEFATVRDTLAAALARTDLPEEAEGEDAPAGARRILELRDTLRERLDGLDGVRSEYLSQQARDDARALASSLSGADGLEGALREFDFQAAGALLATLRGSVGSEEATAWLDALTADVADAARAFRILVRDWSQWRRMSVADPRERRTTNREAVGAQADGLRLAVDGSPVLVPWSAWAGNTDALGTLFRERLSRDYTADERRAIAALMSLSAVVEGLEISEEMFVPGRGAKMSDREAEDILEAFEDVEEWLDDEAQRARWRRERRAARTLVQGLLAASEDRLPEAVAMLDRLLRESPASLLVRMLSDGSTLAPPDGKD